MTWTGSQSSTPVSSVVDEELVNRIGLAPVHEFFFVRFTALDVMVDDGVELTCLTEMLSKVWIPVGICLLRIARWIVSGMPSRLRRYDRYISSPMVVSPFCV